MCCTLLLALSTLAADPANSAPATSAPVPPEIAKWNDDIADLVARDTTELIPRAPIVFYGSSSVRRWDTIAEDMAPWPVVQRGYGGARFSDGTHYAKRVLGPHAANARAIVMFFGNDIAGNKELDVAPAVVADRVRQMLAEVRALNATLPVFVVEVTPTSSRWDQWPAVQQSSHLIRRVLDQDPRAHFLPTAGAFLNADGRPRDELFVDDLLHLNEDGYDLWAALIKAKLHDVLGPALPSYVTRWADDIAAFSELNAAAPDNALLFYGSSSIRLWNTIHEDLAPWPVIQRGYGGAALSDASHYVDQVLAPHNPAAVVLFVGNDIYSLDRTPSDAAADFRMLLSKIRALRGDIPVIWIDIRPVISKLDKWPAVQKLNQLVHEACTSDPHAFTLSANTVFQSNDGQLRADLFAEDQVHLNKQGYALWTNGIREGLHDILGQPTTTDPRASQ